MIDIGAMVSDLIEAGCLPAMAAEVVAKAFAAGVSAATFRGIPVDSAAEKRRAYDRERKRKSAEIHPNSGGTPRNSENASLSKKERLEDKEGKREAPKRGERLPDEWVPTPPDHAVAIELIGGNRVGAELEKFRDHWKQQPGSKGVKLDWNAAWRNWIRRAAEYAGAKNGRRTVHQAADDLLAKIRAFDEPAPRELCGPESEAAVRLLPSR